MRGHYQQQNTHPLNRVFLGWIALIFILLIFKFLWGPGNPDEAEVHLKFTDELSNAQIAIWDKEGKNHNQPTWISLNQSITQKNGTSQISLQTNPKNTINLNEWSKIVYEKKNNGEYTFRLNNKDFWINVDTAILGFVIEDITIKPSANTIVNITKNDLFSTLSVFRGSLTITIDGQSLEVSSGKQLTFYSSNKSQTISDLEQKITLITQDNLESEWMRLNNASSYILKEEPTTNTSISTGEGGLIIFDTLRDESTINTSTINITGRILNTTVARVTINGLPTNIDPAKQTFELTNVELKSSENNLVYRTFNVSWALLSKGIITLYSTTWSASGSVSSGNTDAGQLETYKLDNRYTIIAPSTDFYETRETNVKIEWRVAAGLAHYIKVNGFKLSSFKSKWTNWHYFANQQFGFLQEGINTYVIQYFDSQDKEIHKQLFIIKKLPPFSSSGVRKPITSWEVSR